MGVIADPFGETEMIVDARDRGLLSGKSYLAVVNQADGLFHIAKVQDVGRVENVAAESREELELDPLTVPD